MVPKTGILLLEIDFAILRDHCQICVPGEMIQNVSSVVSHVKPCLKQILLWSQLLCIIMYHYLCACFIRSFALVIILLINML